MEKHETMETVGTQGGNLVSGTVEGKRGFGGFVQRNWKKVVFGVGGIALGYLIGRKGGSSNDEGYYYEETMEIEEDTE